jgi:hypothetical protein
MHHLPPSGDPVGPAGRAEAPGVVQHVGDPPSRRAGVSDTPRTVPACCPQPPTAPAWSHPARQGSAPMAPACGPPLTARVPAPQVSRPPGDPAGGPSRGAAAPAPPDQPGHGWRPRPWWRGRGFEAYLWRNRRPGPCCEAPDPAGADQIGEAHEVAGGEEKDVHRPPPPAPLPGSRLLPGRVPGPGQLPAGAAGRAGARRLTRGGVAEDGQALAGGSCRRVVLVHPRLHRPPPWWARGRRLKAGRRIASAAPACRPPLTAPMPAPQVSGPPGGPAGGPSRGAAAPRTPRLARPRISTSNRRRWWYGPPGLPPR